MLSSEGGQPNPARMFRPQNQGGSGNLGFVSGRKKV
jgi:hypothetical protein